MEFYRAEMPHYVCGFWVDDDEVIVEAAPIMRWAIGRRLETFRIWAKSRDGQVVNLKSTIGELLSVSETPTQKRL